MGENLKIGVQFRITEVKHRGYTLMTEPLFTGTLDSSNRDVTITACNNADLPCRSRAARDLQPIPCLQHSLSWRVFIFAKISPPQNGRLMVQF